MLQTQVEDEGAEPVCNSYIEATGDATMRDTQALRCTGKILLGLAETLVKQFVSYTGNIRQYRWSKRKATAQ